MKFIRRLLALANRKGIREENRYLKNFKDKKLRCLVALLKNNHIEISEYKMGWTQKPFHELETLKPYRIEHYVPHEYRGHVDGSNNIYIHPNHLNANNIFHKLGLSWVNTLKKNHPKSWEKIAKTIKKPSEYSREEALARAIGNTGEHVFSMGDFKDISREFKKQTKGLDIWELSL